MVYSLDQLPHQVFDAQRGDRVERRAWLVHQNDLRFHGDGARDAQPLLLTWVQVERRVAQPVA
jgi:hypothetical protein